MDVNLNEPVEAAQRLRLQGQQFLQGQRADTGEFLGRYTGAIMGQPTMTMLASRIGDELNLPTLRSNAQGLQNTLFQLPETYGSATRGFDVNNNQLRRIIGQKYSEIAPAAELAQSNLASAENQLGTRLGYEVAQQNKELLPYQSEQSLLIDRLAREASFFSQADQRELDSIIAKMNAGVTLSEGEKDRANQLAIAEKGYQNALEVARINASSKEANTPYTSVGEGGSIYDQRTGKIVATASKSYKGGNNGW